MQDNSADGRVSLPAPTAAALDDPKAAVPLVPVHGLQGHNDLLQPLVLSLDRVGELDPSGHQFRENVRAAVRGSSKDGYLRRRKRTAKTPYEKHQTAAAAEPTQQGSGNNTAEQHTRAAEPTQRSQRELTQRTQHS